MRVQSEHTYGMLKARMRQLLRGIWLSSLKLIVQTIMAAVVLHNICLLDADEFRDFYEENLAIIDRDFISSSQRVNNNHSDDEDDENDNDSISIERPGHQFRDELVRQIAAENINITSLRNSNFWESFSI